MFFLFLHLYQFELCCKIAGKTARKLDIRPVRIGIFTHQYHQTQHCIIIPDDRRGNNHIIFIQWMEIASSASSFVIRLIFSTDAPVACAEVLYPAFPSAVANAPPIG